MEHLNKICALAHIQEILDDIASVALDEDDEAVIMDELMRECTDLALVTNQQHAGQCSFEIEQLGYGLQRLAGQIATARRDYLVGDDRVPAWQAKLERDRTIENCLEMAGVVADCFAKARAEESGIKYATLLNERSAKFKSIDLDYYAEPDVCKAYGDPCPFGLKHEGCRHADTDGDGNLVCGRLS